MDTSLIPRPASHTDPRRRAEENAREAERRTSARNNDNATIGAGGKLTLEGGIDVTGEGVVRVVGTGYTAAGEPYEVTARLTSFENEGNYGTYESPALIFGSGIFGDNDNARVWSRSGNDIWIDAGVAGIGRGTVTAGSDGATMGYTSDDPALGTDYRSSSVKATDEPEVKYIDTQADTEAGLKIKTYEDPTGTLHVGHFTWRTTLFSRLRTKLGGKLWLESNSAAGESAVYMDGAGNLDLQTTGTLTHNGAPIGAGGAGTWADLADKPAEFPPEAHTHAIGDTTGLQTALDGKAPAGPQHAEFTLTGVQVPSGGPLAAYVGTFVADTDNTTGAAFATTPGPGKIALPAGTYAIHHFLDCKNTMGTGAVVAIANSTLTKRYTSLDVVAGSWNAGANHPCIYLPAPATLAFAAAQFGGAARASDVRVYIEKIK